MSESRHPDETAAIDEEVPLWDVALEAMLVDEYEKHDRPLTIEDFRRLASEYKIRFDDIMATVFELTLHGRWTYLREDGVPRVFLRDEVERFYVNGRLDAADLSTLTGGWVCRPPALEAGE